MQVGDLVVFRSDTVPGIIVREHKQDPARTGSRRFGILWNDCDSITWEPMEYLKVISENGGEQK
jgi:hypothetical protein